MTVEEIKRAIALIDEVDRLQSKGIIDVEEIASHQEMCDICYDLHGLLKNELERVGKNIVELPCKIGDIIWFKMTDGTMADGKVVDYTHSIFCGFCAVVVSVEGTFSKMNVPFRDLASDKNKTIFFTKEEAEKALKERKNNDK